MYRQHAELVLVRKRFQSRHEFVVAAVAVVPRRLPHLLQSVEHYKLGVRVFADEVFKLPVKTVDGVDYVAVRALFEGLGRNVTWYGDSRCVSIGWLK